MTLTPLAKAKIEMHRAAIAYHMAAKRAVELMEPGGHDLSGPTLEAVTRDKLNLYTAALDRVSDELQRIVSARGGKPPERRPAEEREEDSSLVMQERQDLQEGAPRP